MRSCGTTFGDCLGFVREARSALKFSDILPHDIKANPAVSELALGTHLNKPGIGQFFQMMGDRRLGDRKPVYDLSANHFVGRRGHLFEYFEPTRIRQGLRDALKLTSIHVRRL
jgi:hypothetical protein